MLRSARTFLWLELAFMASGGGLTGRPDEAIAQELALASRTPRFLYAESPRAKPMEIDVERTAVLKLVVSLRVEQPTVGSLLAEIERQTGLTFAYGRLVWKNRPVTLQAASITVASALAAIFYDAGVDVVLSPGGHVSFVATKPEAQPGRVGGQVTDGVKHEGIAGAEVLLEGTKWRTLTGEDGRYVLADVAPGSYTITARRIGYARQSEPVTVADGQEVTVDFALQPVAATLGEVVVMAQKREERLIDVPQSVTVLPADHLARTGATQFRDFANTVPGLSFETSGAGFTQVTLRGVTSGLAISPTVGIYVDEVPFGSSSAFSQSAQFTLDVGLFDLDHVEVLRGPQGTLYGASTMGGLIKYVTARPDAGQFRVHARGGTSATHDGGVNADGAVAINAPLVPDKVAFRASGFYAHDGGYIDNLTLGEKDANRSGVYGGRADLLFTPTRRLSIRLSGFLQDISRDGEATADYTFAGVPVTGSLSVQRPLSEPFHQRFRLGSGTVTYDLRSATFASISSYQTVRSKLVWDLSPAYVPLLQTFLSRSYSAVGAAENETTDKFTQEIRLASTGTKPLEWLIGGFYTHETSGNEQAFVLRDSGGQQAPNDLFTFSSPSRYEEYAAFGDLTYRLTSRLDVTGGIRYAHNRQRFEQLASGVFGVSTPLARSGEDVFTYLANARYHIADNATGYLRFATGYRPGGPNFVVIDGSTGLPAGPPTFEADRLRSYEVGLKAETPDRRLEIDVAGYHIDWSNIQIAVVRGGFGAIANAPGGASVDGAELSLAARPTPGLALAGTLAYQDAHMKEADADLGASKGQRLPDVPRFTASLNADYELLAGNWKPTVGAALRYVGDRLASWDNSVSRPQYQLPHYTTVDLRTGATFGAVSMQLYVRNLFDERGQLSAYTWQGLPRPAILQPRTFGLTASTAF
jgi:iron complex outermembrane receptor protein